MVLVKNTGSVMEMRSVATVELCTPAASVVTSPRWNLTAMPRTVLVASGSSATPVPLENRTVTGTRPPLKCSASEWAAATGLAWNHPVTAIPDAWIGLVPGRWAGKSASMESMIKSA